MSEIIEIQVICDFEPVTIQVFEAGEGVTLPIAQSDVTGLPDALETAQKSIAGIVDFDLTGSAGPHTVTIIPAHSGFALDIRANLDDVVTIIVGNDIILKQPITLRLTGVFTRELRAANTDIVIEANDVLDDAGVDYVDITGETINTVQIMRKSNNKIWVI